MYPKVLGKNMYRCREKNCNSNFFKTIKFWQACRYKIFSWVTFVLMCIGLYYGYSTPEYSIAIYIASIVGYILGLIIFTVYNK